MILFCKFCSIEVVRNNFDSLPIDLFIGIVTVTIEKRKPWKFIEDFGNIFE